MVAEEAGEGEGVTGVRVKPGVEVRDVGVGE